MPYPRLAARLYGAPLLITPEKAKILEEVFRAHLEATAPRIRAMDDDYVGESDEARAARIHEERCQRYAGISLQRRDDKPYALTQSGIALVPVLGTLIQRGSWMDSVSGLTSYDMLASLLDRSMADPDVRGIMLEFDTPGGEVPGAFELQARIVAASARKPVYAHANEQALSAGYLLASGAERVYAAMTSHVGSIGVLMLHVDQSKRDAQMGVAYTFIYAGDRKVDANSHAPLSDRAHAWAKAEVDRTYGLFVDAVAQGRELTADAVKATQAGVYNPADAEEAGLIDGMSTLTEAVQQLEQDLAGTDVFTGARVAGRSIKSTTGETHMKNASTAALAVLAALGVTAESVSDANGAKLESSLLALTDAARTEAKAAGVKEGEEKGNAAGAKAERERVRGILTHAEAKDRIGLAMSVAFETEMSLDQAGKLLVAAPKQAGSGALAALMAATPNPKVGTDGGADPAGGAPRIDTKSIYERFNARSEQ